MGAADPADDRVAALGREVERLTRQVTKNDTQLRELAARILGAAPGPAGADAQPGDGPAEELPAWLTILDFPDATAGMDGLAQWLAAVYLRFPGAELRECWAWHADVVQELWWLRHAWRDAHAGEKPSWMKVGDWHDRQRPGVVKRITAALKSCGLDRHTPPGETGPVVPLVDALPHVVTAWTSTNRAAWPATPTPAQLAEAQRLEDARLPHRRGHP